MKDYLQGTLSIIFTQCRMVHMKHKNQNMNCFNLSMKHNYYFQFQIQSKRYKWIDKLKLMKYYKEHINSFLIKSHYYKLLLLYHFYMQFHFMVPMVDYINYNLHPYLLLKPLMNTIQINKINNFNYQNSCKHQFHNLYNFKQQHLNIMILCSYYQQIQIN